MNADNHAADLNTTTNYTYDPLGRIAQVTKTGDASSTETYVHDPNNNVVSQTIKGTTTTFNYDRNRLLSSATGGVSSSYDYDPFGRLDTVTAAGQVVERETYDGFDRIAEHQQKNASGALVSTKYTYDPLDRTTSMTTDPGGANQKTTNYSYLGLSDQVLNENVAGQITKAYRYTPWDERLSQVKTNTDGSKEDTYYGYNDHTDVEDVTDTNGDIKATYGYTAYGQADDAETTGIDKPDPQDPTKEPYNVYRYESKRWDSGSSTYDMGFRDYDPGLNQFLTRDTYRGALDDQSLLTDPFTANRYAFAGGNPIGSVEEDGHKPDVCGTGADSDAAACSSWESAQAEAAPWKYNASRHNRARDAAANVIRLKFLMDGDYAAAASVRTEYDCPIDNGGKDGAVNGRADICATKGHTMYVWEVKSSGVANKGKGELDDYIEDMSNDPRYKGLNIVPGFKLPIPAVGYVGPTNERVVADNHPTDDGVIVYKTSKWRGPPPIAIPEKVPQRVPSPRSCVALKPMPGQALSCIPGAPASPYGAFAPNAPIIGGIGLGTLWWIAKLGSPACGPAAPACALAF